MDGATPGQVLLGCRCLLHTASISFGCTVVGYQSHMTSLFFSLLRATHIALYYRGTDIPHPRHIHECLPLPSPLLLKAILAVVGGQG